jgi:GDP-L-fucose synthase
MSFLITGATGLLGSEFSALGEKCELLSSKDCDLLNQDFCEFLKPEHKVVIHCAARVGGVKSNTEKVAQFFDDNVRMNMNVMRGCKNKNIKLVSILSTCIYPDAAYVQYPLTEEQLHLGPPHPSNFGYAYAKRMLEVQARAYRQQYNSNFITVIPNSLYGPNDNYDLESGHVIPALIRKFYEAKLKNDNQVIVWGSGNPLREFSFAKDIAKIILWLSKNYDGSQPVNIGNPEQISIKELAMTIAKEINYEGNIVFDSTKPDGQYKKPSSNKFLRTLGWDGEYTSFKDGLKETIKVFETRYPNIRGI